MQSVYNTATLGSIVVSSCTTKNTALVMFTSSGMSGINIISSLNVQNSQFKNNIGSSYTSSIYAEDGGVDKT